MTSPGESGPIEQACPNCGEPMLAGWGATCGRCKPRLAYPKTIVLASGLMNQLPQPGAPLPPSATQAQQAALQEMALGWLAVMRTATDDQKGMLIELSEPAVVLTRAGSLTGQGREVEIEDSFMSAGHAVVRRPANLARDAFTVEDRRVPGPSANGTFLNGRRLAAGEVAKLGDGDVVRVGVTELLFKSLYLPPGFGGV